jgi:hypothetical protein
MRISHSSLEDVDIAVEMAGGISALLHQSKALQV